MASGYCDSWVSTNGDSTGGGAFYRLHWSSTYVSPGVTRVDWSLQGCGRTSSPTWLLNECHVSVDQAGTIYSMEWGVNQSTGDGTNTSFNPNSDKSWRSSGSFNVSHSDANPLTLNVSIYASFYNGNDTGSWAYSTITVDANSPAACKIWNGSSWVTATPYIWNGSSWVIATPYVWNGSSWVISKG